MRKVLTILILLHTVSAQAQITLTAATSTPLPGDTASFYVVNGNNPGNSGAAVTWDYSWVTSANLRTLYYHIPGTVCDPYPGQLASSGTGSCDYYNVNSNSFSLSRSFAGIYYEYGFDNKLVLEYPLTYNSQVYFDVFERRDSIPNTFVNSWQYGTQQISSDAYGTLILPDSTYTDVLRVKKVIHFSTHWFMLSGAVQTDLESYEWYSANHRTFLLQVNNMIHDGLSVSEQFVTEKVNIYPNPASGKFNIELDSAPTHIYLKDITGKKMLEIPVLKGAQRYSMDVSGFAGGIYFLEVGTTHGILVKKIQVL